MSNLFSKFALYIKNRGLVEVKGKGNIIEIKDNKKNSINKVRGLKLHVLGNNNKVIINSPADFTSSEVWISGDNCTFIFDGSKMYINRMTVKILKGGYVKIGEGTSIISKCFISSQGAKIEIGKDCMFAADVTVRDNDGHPIYDKKGKIINNPSDVKIGDHVWIGLKTIILKGVQIGSNNVIGAGSIISKSITETNSIIAKNPPQTIKKEIHWER